MSALRAAKAREKVRGGNHPRSIITKATGNVVRATATAYAAGCTADLAPDIAAIRASCGTAASGIA